MYKRTKAINLAKTLFCKNYNYNSKNCNLFIQYLNNIYFSILESSWDKICKENLHFNENK